MLKSILLVWLNDMKLLLFYDIEQLTIDSYTLTVLTVVFRPDVRSRCFVLAILLTKIMISFCFLRKSS
jgi:hypothetical protein